MIGALASTSRRQNFSKVLFWLGHPRVISTMATYIGGFSEDQIDELLEIHGRQSSSAGQQPWLP